LAFVSRRGADVEADPVTEAMVIFGEIGPSEEEELAQLIVDGKVTKPNVFKIGAAAREGTLQSCGDH
jgi:succinyl-CoA synthetase alpha subunit